MELRKLMSSDLELTRVEDEFAKASLQWDRTKRLRRRILVGAVILISLLVALVMYGQYQEATVAKEQAEEENREAAVLESQKSLVQTLRAKSKILHMNDMVDESLAITRLGSQLEVELDQREHYYDLTGDDASTTGSRTLQGHDDDVNIVKISNDGTFIVTGSEDNTAKIWNANDGTLRHTLQGHEDEINTLRISSDDTFIVTGSEDNTAKIWNSDNGALIKTLQGHDDDVNIVKISSDGTFIVTGSEDKTAKKYGMQTMERCYKGMRTRSMLSASAAMIHSL